MKDVTIRQINEKDNTALASVIRAVFEEHDAPRQGTVYSDPTTDNLSKLFSHPASVLWVAVEKDEILGCCGIYPTEGLPEGCAELVKFYLKKKARGRGIGGKLLSMSIDWARRMKYSQLYIESLPHYATAVSIYEKLGFKNLEAPLGNSQHPGCNIWMLKNL